MRSLGKWLGRGAVTAFFLAGFSYMNADWGSQKYIYSEDEAGHILLDAQGKESRTFSPYWVYSHDVSYEWCIGFCLVGAYLLVGYRITTKVGVKKSS